MIGSSPYLAAPHEDGLLGGAVQQEPAASLPSGDGLRHLGFSGTRQGMTDPQLFKFGAVVTAQLIDYHTVVFHHGCCVGADEQAARASHEMLVPLIEHPADGLLNMVALDLPPAWQRREPKPHLKRNLDIIRESGLVVACPSSRVEQKRGSGTWQVIRECTKQGVPLIIIWPDGEHEERT